MYKANKNTSEMRKTASEIHFFISDAVFCISAFVLLLLQNIWYAFHNKSKRSMKMSISNYITDCLVKENVIKESEREVYSYCLNRSVAEQIHIYPKHANVQDVMPRSNTFTVTTAKPGSFSARSVEQHSSKLSTPHFLNSTSDAPTVHIPFHR